MKVSQGVPYCVGALEDFIAIGSSDGSVRLFDTHSENELKIITTKEVKGNAVTCLDIKRVKGDHLLHIIAGHAKGQVVLYEVKGLPKTEQKKLLNLVTFRCLKIVADAHIGQMIQVKFYGDFRSDSKNVNVASCDIHGTVYLLKYFDNVIGHACTQRCFWRKRLNGPSYIISPLFYQERSQYEIDQQIQRGGTANPFLQDVSAYELERRAHLIAFGALERVIVTSVAPQPAELVAIERPDYIDS